MKKILSIVLLASITATTVAIDVCERCEVKNENRNWVVRNSRAAKCWIARKVFRSKKHQTDAAVKNACARCGKTHR